MSEFDSNNMNMDINLNTNMNTNMNTDTNTNTNTNTNANTGFEPIKLVIFIVNRGEGRKVNELCTKEGIYGHLLLHGRGTVDNKTASLLGLDEREKDIVLLTVAQSKKDEIMERITEKLELNKPAHGIAMSIPLSSVASQLNSYSAIAGITGAAKELSDAGEKL